MSLPAEVVSTIQSYHMFAEGVPADDATCNAIIEVLKSLDINGRDQRLTKFTMDELDNW